MTIVSGRVWLGVLGLSLAAVAADVTAQEGEQYTSLYGDDEFITLATGTRKPVARAPSVASVVTAEEIAAIGATDLDQVLETLPGIHVSYSNIGYNPKYLIRGIHSEFNPEVLMLVNGIPLSSLFHGDRGNVWGGMSVQDIARIEVIRGPGSALYGADAFAGVINIITKGAGDINGREVGARLGSNQDREVWAQYGGKQGGVDVAFSLIAGSTDGADGIVDADAQTSFDSLFGSNASLAPGPVNRQRDYLDLRLDLVKGPWHLGAAYENRDNMGTGAGVGAALDPDGRLARERWMADLTYKEDGFAPDWDVMAQLSFMDYSQETSLNIFPVGAVFPGGVFPDGVYGSPGVAERHIRLGFSTLYRGFVDHRLRFGAGYNYGNVYEVMESKNFSSDPSGFPVPLGSIVDVSDTGAVFLREDDAKRDNFYLFAQDEWALAPDWELTAGLRYDNYSDFGDTVNPRLALVWAVDYDFTAKLLYGRAFLAPAFAELYNINNPVVVGNPQLAPETTDTVELALDYRPLGNWRAGGSLFAYEMRDIIRYVPDPVHPGSNVAANSGSQRGYGMELEGEWTPSDTFRLVANYTYQRSRDEETDSDPGYAPHHQTYLRGEWKFRDGWKASTQLNWVADRARSSGDTRPEIDDYVTVDGVLRYAPMGGDWELAASIRNLFDEDVREPSLAPGAIVNDLPLPGRTFYVQALYHFD